MSTLEQRLSDIEARLKAATPGPFTQTRDLSTVELSVGGELWLKLESDDYGTDRACDKLMQRFADAKLIAHAPADLSFLLAALKVAREALEINTGGDLASGEGIFKAETAREALAEIERLVGDV